MKLSTLCAAGLAGALVLATGVCGAAEEGLRLVDVPYQDVGAADLPVPAYRPPAPQGPWVVDRGAHLKAIVHSWAQIAGWQVSWEYEGDFESGAGATFRGDFRSAIRALFDALPETVRLKAELRPDNTPPLLVVSRLEKVQ